MMLFDQAFRRELNRSFAATVVVILTIVLTMMLIRTLAQAAQGSASPQDVVLLLGYATLSHLATVLTLSLFVAIVLVVGRMYRDSEMVVWMASGVSLTRLLRPIARTAWPVVVVTFVLLFFSWPWVHRQSLELRDRYAQRSDLARVSPGLFQSSADGRRIFFVDTLSDDAQQARNIFVMTQQGHVEAVTSAATGHLSVTESGRSIVLEKGHRAETDSRTGERSTADFGRYVVRMSDESGSAGRPLRANAEASMTLLASNDPLGQGEMAWRLGMSLAPINLTLLALGLAPTSPRRPSNWNLILALLAFIIYTNLVMFSQAWVAQGRVSLVEGLTWLHGGAAALALGLLAWRGRGPAALAPVQWWSAWRAGRRTSP
jgi:lipopolysaccharide export system permease protein